MIDRGDSSFANYDRQVINSVELQARLDTSRFFLNLGAARIFTNQIYDGSRAAQPGLGTNTRADIPDCFNHGFGNGAYLLTQGLPTQTLNLTLGGRFFERRLKLGTRATWYSAYKKSATGKILTLQQP